MSLTEEPYLTCVTLDQQLHWHGISKITHILGFKKKKRKVKTRTVKMIQFGSL